MKKQNNLTELVFILDRSGSMCRLEEDTMGGFNSLIKKQRRQEGKCLVTTVLFDDEFDTIHNRVPLEDVKDMTKEEYFVGGCTALLDAVGETISKIDSLQGDTVRDKMPQKTVFVIITDGMENASRKYSAVEVKKMIEKQKEKYGWEFLFLGANIDAVETASHMGISSDRAVTYHPDEKGTRTNFEAVSKAVCSMRAEEAVGAEWKKEVEDYYSLKNTQKQTKNYTKKC